MEKFSDVFQVKTITAQKKPAKEKERVGNGLSFQKEKQNALENT